MKKMQKIGQLVLISLILTGIVSCNKDENIEAFEVIGDAMILKRMVGDTTYYARSYYAYGNYAMTEASVTLAEGGTVALTAADATKRTYMKEPTIDDFSTTPPVTGTFEFSVMNEGIEHTSSDLLSFSNLDFPTITTANYNSSTITVEWEQVTTAENYLVRMVDENYDLVFTGYLLSNTALTYQIGASTGTWSQTPVDGETYMIEVHAFLYDNDASTDDYFYNIDEISIASQNVVWGE